MQNDATMNAAWVLHEDALPTSLFMRLRDAVLMIGSERMKSNGSYSTTFWYSRGAAPTNLAEEAIEKLIDIVKPGNDCIGTEWWLGRLGNGKKLRFHFDRDLALQKKTGEVVCPINGSVLYLNDYPSTPTVIVDQVPDPDGSKIPEQAAYTEAVDAIANRYMMFAGNLRHGVIPNPEKLHLDPRRQDGNPERRLTLLVNYWNRRPLAPVCNDYDGSIYPSLRDGFMAVSNRLEPIPA